MNRFREEYVADNHVDEKQIGQDYDALKQMKFIHWSFWNAG